MGITPPGDASHVRHTDVTRSPAFQRTFVTFGAYGPAPMLPRKPTTSSPAAPTPPSLGDLITRQLSRRAMLVGSGSAFLFGGWLTACSETEGSGAPTTGQPVPDGGLIPTSPTADAAADAPVPPKPLVLGFDAVPKGRADALVIPAGYSATVLFRLGDPIADGVPAFANDGTDSASSFALRAGDHHDGMYFFCLGANGKWDTKVSDKALLVMNHEAITPAYLHLTGPTVTGSGAAAVRAVASEVDKEMNAHGVSVIEIRKTGNKWAYLPASSLNRRITTSTPMELTGPAAGSAHMVTKYSTDGKATRGTINNCANGWTPWGTYLTCEENWAGYFRRLPADNANRTAKELAAFARYAIAGNGRELWATMTPDTPDELYGRWNAAVTGASADGSDDYRNVANTFGWVVEIDPFAVTSTPKKRTALGRLAHEGAWVGAVVPGKPLVFYMGCDSRNEYIYKFVSKAPWSASDVNGGLAAGAKYLDEGKLYVAKLEADGTGTWVELAFGMNGITAANAAYAFADAADVLVHTRLAADAAGGTKMDRPEWAAVHPKSGEVYFTLTNTNAASRPVDKVDAANPRFYDDPKGAGGTPQKGNPNGHIVRIAEAGSDPAATTFKWDVYLFGARAAAAQDKVNLSRLTADNDFSSPDGLYFSAASPGLLWIQTDDSAYNDVTNCMMLAAIPGSVGDGAKATVANANANANADGATQKSVDTYAGRAPTSTSLRRFLVGPRECEITGIAESPDGKALFVNVQHPGEDTAPNFSDPTTYGSHWPDGGTARPRSATIVITRDDGGVIGTT